jgi:hypothetical protein
MNLATVDSDPEPEFLNFYGTQASVPYNMLPLSASDGISNIPSSSRALFNLQFTVWARKKIFFIDSIHGSYSTPGIDFSPLNPSKNLATD